MAQDRRGALQLQSTVEAMSSKRMSVFTNIKALREIKQAVVIWPLTKNNATALSIHNTNLPWGKRIPNCHLPHHEAR